MTQASGAKAENTIVRPSGFTTPSNTMDVPRAGVAKKKRQKRIIYIAAGVLGLIVITFLLSRLKPAVPSIDRSTVWIDTVKRGPMVRQVRGLGTLVPVDIRWVAANTDGRVEKIIVWPGTEVKADTVILELTSPELEQTAGDAESKAKAVEAELTTLRATLQRELLDQESTTARVHSEYEQAKMERQTNDQLAKNGLVSELVYKTSKVKEAELANRDQIETKRLEFSKSSIEPQIASKQASVNQAKDIQNNQVASIDTRNGVVAGHVIRVDPAVEQGTVTVDVAIDGDLPKGARPDLSVDGTIELERLDNVIYVGRPAFGQENNTVGIFKLVSGTSEAVRTPVKLGRSSVNTIEIISGLEPGDQVILSDTSSMDAHERIRLN